MYLTGSDGVPVWAVKVKVEVKIKAKAKVEVERGGIRFFRSFIILVYSGLFGVVSLSLLPRHPGAVKSVQVRHIVPSARDQDLILPNIIP